MSEKLYKPILIDSVKATANLKSKRFVNFTGGVCQAGKKAYGVCDIEIDSGQYAPIVVLGVLLVESGGAITQGVAITSDAEGRAVTATADSITTSDNSTTLQKGDAINGYALDSASGAGEVIRVLRGI